MKKNITFIIASEERKQTLQQVKLIHYDNNSIITIIFLNPL